MKQPEGNAGLLTDWAFVADQPNAAAPASQSFRVSATWYPLEQVDVPFAANVNCLDHASPHNVRAKPLFLKTVVRERGAKNQ